MTKMLALLAVLMLVGASYATVVETWIQDEGAGNFKVWASTSDGDNLGLASFDIAFLGGSINASQPVNTSPVSMWAPLPTWAPAGGFALFRSGIGTIPFQPLSAAQDTAGAAGLQVYYGIGNSIVNFSTANGFFRIPASGIAGQARDQYPKAGFTYMVELGDGTYTGTCPTIGPAGTSFTILLTVGGNPGYPDTVRIIPEPATLGLLALGSLLLLRRRR